jgi:uncharacterized protein
VHRARGFAPIAFFGRERGKFGLFELMGVQDSTAEFLGCKADIMTRDSVQPALRKRNEASALRVR